MKTVITVAITLICVMVLSAIRDAVRHRRFMRKRKNGVEKKKGRKRNRKRLLDTYIKIATTVIVAHGLILSTASYVLAAMGKEPVESVSVAIITEIVAPMVTYGITKTVENIFEKNKLKFSTPIKSVVEESEEEFE